MPRFMKSLRTRFALTVLALLVGGIAALAPYSGGG